MGGRAQQRLEPSAGARNKKYQPPHLFFILKVRVGGVQFSEMKKH